MVQMSPYEASTQSCIYSPLLGDDSFQSLQEEMNYLLKVEFKSLSLSLLLAFDSLRSSKTIYLFGSLSLA